MLTQLDNHIQKKKEIEALSHTIHKMSSKCIKYLNISAKTIKCFKVNLGLNLYEFGFFQWNLRYDTKYTNNKGNKTN